MVALEKIIEADDILELKGLIEKHQTYTGSEVAGRVLNKWEETLTQFVKVMPLDYKRVLQERKEAQKMVAAGG
jgi:glutamate synthase domain-containing protein 3